MSDRPGWRTLLRASRLAVLFLVALAPVGVAAAVVLRSGHAPSPPPKPTVVSKVNARAPVLSLNDVRGRSAAGADFQTGDPQAKVERVIGVGTGDFRDGSTGGPDGSTGGSDGSTGGSGGPPDTATALSDAGIVDVQGGVHDPSQLKPPSDPEIRSELAAFRKFLAGADARDASHWYIDKQGRAHAPRDVPREVGEVVAAANAIATLPYKWGGGHGAWRDNGYDCSGSVSFALAGAHLLDSPLDSSGLMRYGSDGPGRWISIYANPGHVWMRVGPVLRFDTSGQSGAGTRWQYGNDAGGGFTTRHPTGL